MNLQEQIYRIQEMMGVISESEYDNFKPLLFRFWEENPPKSIEDVKETMNYFSIPNTHDVFVYPWLIEFYGGLDKLNEEYNKFVKVVMRAQLGTYDFNYYITKIDITSFGDVYLNAIVDGDGEVELADDDGEIINNIFDATKNESMGWEIEDEIKDVLIYSFAKNKEIPFDVYVDKIAITSPKKFKQPK
jgi:hypothetical protein